jgi:hypothetical protein
MTNYCMLRSTLMLRWAENRTQDRGRSNSLIWGGRGEGGDSCRFSTLCPASRPSLMGIVQGCATRSVLFYVCVVFLAGLSDRLKGRVIECVRVSPYGCVSSSAIWTWTGESMDSEEKE